jgi:CRISPR type III-associated protein (TIGR04423 family)
MKIEKAKYQGYLWYSDEQVPKILDDEVFELEIGNTQNPFIIEGQLFDGIHSISIKFIDGKYIVKQFIISDFEGIDKDDLYLYPNRMKILDDNNLKLHFCQYWRAKADKYCGGDTNDTNRLDSKDNGMLVLQPAELVFVGFKNKED